MSAISLINSGVAWFVAAAVLAFLFSFQKALSGWIAGIGGAVGSLYTAAAGFTVLTGAVGVSGALSLVSYDVQISPLNAIWLITLGLCGLYQHCARQRLYRQLHGLPTQKRLYSVY